MPRPPRAAALAIFVAVLGLNLLSSSREPAWGDARGMWQVAERLVGAGAIDISVRWPEDIPAGRGGKYYGIAPLGPSLVHVPGAALTRAVRGAWPRQAPLVQPLATHLAPAALGALACALFFSLACFLGVRPRTASLCAAILAVGTMTWVYARYPYSEILQLACFLGLFGQVLRVAEAGAAGAPVPRRAALWLGAWAGCLFNAKYVFGAAIVGGGLVVAWALRARRRELARVVGWAAVGGAPLLALALWYNWARWGAIGRTGYEPYLDAYFGGSVFDGAWGMLLSPNKSALLYSPPLVLALWGLPAAVRARPRYGHALAAMVLPVFLVYATYRSWSGDYAWGPRFFVWAVPVLLLPLGFFLDVVAAGWRRWARAAVLAAAVTAGVAVQVLGGALYWDHFIRVAIDAKNQWLGQPDRAGAYVPERGRGHCDSCFEDTYELLWAPPFHPIRGHAWLLASLARGDDAAAAAARAPWRRYTTLAVDLSRTYPRARLDWWGMIWLADAPQTRPLGLAVLAALALLLVAGVARWLAVHRRLDEDASAGQ